MIEERAEGSSGPSDGNRADRQHQREYIVLPASVSFDGDVPCSCGLMDISVGGAKIKVEIEAPEDNSEVSLAVDALKLRIRGSVIRTYSTPTGVEIAIRFERLYSEVPRGLLDYKLRSFRDNRGGRGRR